MLFYHIPPRISTPRFFEKKLGKKLHCVPSSLRVSGTSAGPLRPRSHVTFAPVARYDAKFRVAWFAHFVRFENLYRTITLVLCLGGGRFVFGDLGKPLLIISPRRERTKREVKNLKPHGGEPAGLGVPLLGGWVGLDDKRVSPCNFKVCAPQHQKTHRTASPLRRACGLNRSGGQKPLRKTPVPPFEALKVSTGQA